MYEELTHLLEWAETQPDSAAWPAMSVTECPISLYLSHRMGFYKMGVYNETAFYQDDLHKLRVMNLSVAMQDVIRRLYNYTTITAPQLVEVVRQVRSLYT